MSIQDKLKVKIKEDTGYEVKDGVLYRTSLNWSHKSVGRMKWYWLVEGVCVGSSENMKELLNSEKIQISKSFSFIELFTS